MLGNFAEREERTIAQRPFAPMEIPPDTPAAKRQILEESNELQQAFTELRRARADQSREKQQALVARWHETNGAWLAAHLETARELAAQDAARGEPGEIVIEIPTDASSEERAFLHESAAILQEMADLQERLNEVSDAQRQRALAEWQEQNAARLAAHFAEAKRFSAP